MPCVPEITAGKQSSPFYRRYIREILLCNSSTGKDGAVNILLCMNTLLRSMREQNICEERMCVVKKKKTNVNYYCNACQI